MSTGPVDTTNDPHTRTTICPECGCRITPETDATRITADQDEDRRIKLRVMLSTFSRLPPFLDNTARRILMWADRGFRGDP